VIGIGGHRLVVAVDAASATDRPAGSAGGADPVGPDADVVGGYFLVRRLGAGGSGVVYEAQPLGGGSAVALEVLSCRGATDDAARLRFLREAATHLALDHPQIVRLHAHGLDGDACWLTMELCDVGSVADLLQSRRRQLTVSERAPLLLGALDGLAAAHRAGIVHRGIKPHNLLVADVDGRRTAKVADLGLAKCFADAGLSGMTVTGAYAGSWPYMPREQLVDFRSVRPVSDVWSMAATIYEMLTNRLPRDGRAHADPASAVLSEPARPIRRLRCCRNRRGRSGSAT
jgi:serine/threonine protein kinase